MTWVVIGFAGQALFSARFLYQWIASERLRRSVIPEAFWYFSVGGGIVLLAYAIYREDPVFIAGQAAGLVIYARNIYFVWRHKRQAVDAGVIDAGAVGAGTDKAGAGKVA